ncbi:Repeat domain-containing protein [Abditibacterium utsteinense]|uniref:Repeat domain-containing protein n=1 Tax=Abditibacterium utsteinense TaxID=1960156 RepID=A0A2S8SU83_9BACT|nr:VCBS repeat-containing protein [Abditibacterium utsteinense]PQV64351.1 Repeat domain-containing protein [Abditibacterium utsteinense]
MNKKLFTRHFGLRCLAATALFASTLCNAPRAHAAGEKNKYATILYSTWAELMLRPLNLRPDGTPFVMPDCVVNNVWGNQGVYHWWGRPAIANPLQYRMMVNNDPNQPNNVLLDNHADLLFAGGIDFISIDMTNGAIPEIMDGARAVCKRYSQRSAANTPKIAFFVDTATTAQAVYNAFYAGAYPSSIFFQHAGKPLLMVRDASTAIPTTGVFANFTCRRTWGLHNTTSGGTEWSFKDNTPPALPSFKNYGWPEQRSVCAATQSTYMTTTNDGRKGRQNGTYFDAQWRDVASDSPTFVFMTAWNEWGSQNQGGPSNPVMTDTYLTEYSADLEPMQGGHGTQYYDLMKSQIAKYKRNTPNIATRDSSSGIWTFKYYYGAKDLAASNYTFTFPWAAGTQYQSFTGDFNNDGLSDIGLRNYSDGTWYFAARNAGANSFSNNNNLVWASGSNYQCFVGDFNGDGMTDVGMRDSNNGTWYFRQASAPYTYNSQFTFNWTAGTQFQPVLADFNKDGRLDIGMRDTGTGKIQVAIAGAGYAFTPQTTTFNWATGTNYQAFAGDFDRDGYGDVGIRDSANGVMYLANGNGVAGVFSNNDNLRFNSGTTLTTHIMSGQ